jgi:hypothetical protein
LGRHEDPAHSLDHRGVIGELYRSWGVGRPLAFVLDDMLAGAMMLSAAILVRRPSRVTRAYFSAAWGVASGMLYGSFFGKVFDPANATPGNIPLGLLTGLLGFAFFVSIAGLLASILLPDKVTTN